MIGYSLHERREQKFKRVVLGLLLFVVLGMIIVVVLAALNPFESKDEYCERVGVIAEAVTTLKKEGAPLYLIVKKVGPIAKDSVLMMDIYYYDKDEAIDPYRVKKAFMDSCKKYYEVLQ